MAAEPLGYVIDRLATQAPTRPAVIERERVLSRSELARRSAIWAAQLRELNVAPGDFVALALPNGADLVTGVAAAWKLGATPIPLSPKAHPSEVDSILDLLKPRVVLGRFLNAPGVRTTERLFDEGDALRPEEQREPHYFKASLSGGSTGRPKIIVSHMPGRWDPDRPVFEMQRDGVSLALAPFYHSGPFTLAMMSLLSGATLVIEPKFDPEQTLAAIDRHRVDWMFLVPTMMNRIWRLPPETRAQYDLSSLRIVAHAGAPCPHWLKTAWIDWLGADRIAEFYGGTEAQGGTWISGQEWLQRRGSVGKPNAASLIKILRGDGSEAAAGEVGELYIRPADPQAMPTYHYIGATAQRRDDGFETLGDLGWKDEAGYVYLADRRTDLIIRGGANLYPAEIEAALESLASVDSAIAVGVPDEDLGQRVHAFIQTTKPLDAALLAAALRERLPDHKIPTSFTFTSDPLRDEGGKVRRQALARLAQTTVQPSSEIRE